MKNGKTLGILVVLFAVFSAAMFALNTVTGPIIESNNSSEAYAPLFAVIPEAENFEVLYMADGSVETALADVPETVQAIYQETSGLGYALKMSTTKGYTGDAIELTFAVDAEGKVSGIQLDAYPETKDFGADYPGTFIGQDSTLADIQLVAGCTYSSVAFRDAVADGMAALINNNLMAAGVKSNDQLLAELVPMAHTGLVNDKGIAQYEELEGDGASILKILKAPNNSGFGYFVQEGDNALLAVTTSGGGVKILNVDGVDVTADFGGVAETVKAHTAANIAGNTDKDLQRMNMLLADAVVTEIPVTEVFNSVTSAYQLEKDGTVYYGLVSRSYGYGNEVMGVYYVMDEAGTIVNIHVDELIFHSDYFSDYTLDPASYKEGFKGVNAGSWSDDLALISGATMTSDAMKVATYDVFAAFESVKGGAQ